MNQHLLSLMGRATDASEELETKAGKKFRKFSVAVNEYRGPDQESEPYFYDVACFNNQPRTVAQHINKGDVVLIQGKPTVDVYEASNGELKASLGVNASYVCLFNPPRPAEEKEA